MSLPDHGASFPAFYESDRRGEGRPPSSTRGTTQYRTFLEQFIVEHGVRSVLDAGGGDASLCRTVDWKGARYVGLVGLDIAASVVDRSRARYPDIELIQGDVGNIAVGSAFDLLLVRGVLEDWSNEAIHAFLAQPALASFRHVLLTSGDDGRTEDRDVADGEWRPLDPLGAPFAETGARALRRGGTTRIIHRGPRLHVRALLEGFEWWIINLDRRPDRLAHARSELARIGVARARPFQAFDGHRLQLTSQRPDWVRKGAVGCYLSHLALLKQARARRAPCVIVEDDLVVADDFGAAFEAFVQAVPEDWDVLLLSGGEHVRPPEVLGPHHARLVATWGTSMTILRLSAIDRLLEEADMMDRPIDDFYIRMMPSLKFYTPARKLVTQASSLGSNIGDEG